MAEAVGVLARGMRDNPNNVAAFGDYLETDKPENVALYERFGYRVVAESAVIGVPNWFMRRDPAHR